MRIEILDGTYLAELVPSDREALVEHLQEREIYERTLRIPFPYTLADADGFIDFVAKDTAEHGRVSTWAVRAPEGGLIGSAGFMDLEPSRSHRAEIGYWIAKPYWNRGVATATVKTLVDLAFTTHGLERVTANVFEGNIASTRVLEKTGFHLEGRLRKHYRKDGKVFDGLLYARVREATADR